VKESTRIKALVLTTLIGLAPSAHASLIGLYQFEDSANMGADASGRNNNAVSSNVTYSVDGYQGGAASLNGSAYLKSYIDVSVSALPQLTWGAWVKPSSTSSIKTVISSDNGGYDRAINIDNRGGSTWSVFTGSNVQGSGVTPSTSSWTFLAAVYDQATASMTFYVDGQALSFSTNFGSSETYFDIGRNPLRKGVDYFQGLVDNVFVFDEALTASQIATIRSNGFSSSPVPVPPAIWLFGSGLVSLFGFYRRKQTTTRIA